MGAQTGFFSSRRNAMTTCLNTFHFLSLARVARILLPALSLCGLVSTALAEPVGTLDTIRQSRTLTLGIRAGAKPFSFFDASGQPAGYSVDVCMKVAEQIRKELSLNDLKIAKVEVSGADRFVKLKAGVFDLECGTTVNTKSRQGEAAFSYPIFIAGQRILVRDGSLAKLSALADKTVAVTRGTTSEKLFTQLKTQYPGMTVQSFSSNGESFAALESGKVAAFAGLDIVLQGMIAGRKGSYVLSQDSLSVEPMALVVRRDDPKFRELVDKTLGSLYASGEIATIYNRWFRNDTLNVPMSALLRDSINHPSHEPGLSKLSGYAL